MSVNATPYRVEAGPGMLRPTWAEVDLSALRDNLTRLSVVLPQDCKIMFVVKANAYGHGAVRLALFAQENGLCHMMGVSCIEEGMALREAGITMPVLVLGSIYPSSAFAAALNNGLSVTVASLDAAHELAETAQRLNVTARCHIKVDTGMGRIGTRRPGAVRIAQVLAASSHCSIEGIYTHLSSADADTDYTRLQLKHYKDTLADCETAGIKTGLRHAANSHAALHVPEACFDMVRPGFAIYGLADEFSPLLSLKSRIVFLKDVRAGSSIGYSRSFRCKKQTRVATIPIGYADGYCRRFSNCAEALVRGRRVRVAGNISMDMAMLDVSSVEGVSVGDEVVLLGRQGGDEVDAGELAVLAGTIPYEILTSISGRVPRLYLQ